MSAEYIIDAMLPDPFAERLGAIRQTYDQWSKSWLPPHITIVRPIRDVPEGLRQRAGHLEYPLTVTLNGWYAFHNPDANVIWVDPGQEEPSRVAEDINAAYPELAQLDTGRRDHGKPHIYHISVVNRIPDAEFPKLNQELRQLDVSGSCRIERLTLYRRELPNGEWRMLE